MYIGLIKFIKVNIAAKLRASSPVKINRDEDRKTDPKITIPRVNRSRIYSIIYTIDK